jgi:hypothetical protein
MSEQIFLIAKSRRRSNAALTNEQLDRRSKRTRSVSGTLEQAGKVNPVAGGLGELLGSEKSFRTGRGATYDEARAMQTHDQRKRAGTLVGAAGGVVAGSQVKDPRNYIHFQHFGSKKMFNKPKLKELARSKRAVAGGAALAGGSIYAHAQGRKRGAVEDKAWSRIVREHPYGRGF